MDKQDIEPRFELGAEAWSQSHDALCRAAFAEDIDPRTVDQATLEEKVRWLRADSDELRHKPREDEDALMKARLQRLEQENALQNLLLEKNQDRREAHEAAVAKLLSNNSEVRRERESMKAERDTARAETERWKRLYSDLEVGGEDTEEQKERLGHLCEAAFGTSVMWEVVGFSGLLQEVQKLRETTNEQRDLLVRVVGERDLAKAEVAALAETLQGVRVWVQELRETIEVSQTDIGTAQRKCVAVKKQLDEAMTRHMQSGITWSATDEPQAAIPEPKPEQASMLMDRLWSSEDERRRQADEARGEQL